MKKSKNERNNRKKRISARQGVAGLSDTRNELKKLKSEVRRNVRTSTARGKAALEHSIEAREIQLKIAQLEVKLGQVERLETGAKKDNRRRKLRHEVAVARRSIDVS